jgi:hypothetical protein
MSSADVSVGFPPAYAACYAFSCALFVFVVFERISNAVATLLVRLVWGRESSNNQTELLGSALTLLKSRYGLKSGDYDAQAYFVLSMSDELATGAMSMHDVKGYASMQMVGAGMTFYFTIITSIMSCIASAISALSMYLMWAAAATLVFSLLFVIQENYANVLVEAVDQYNETYGPLLHKLLFIPLQVNFAYVCASPHLHMCTCEFKILCVVC